MEFSEHTLSLKNREKLFLETVVACNLESLKKHFNNSGRGQNAFLMNYQNQSHYLPWRQRTGKKGLFQSEWAAKLDRKYDTVCESVSQFSELYGSREIEKVTNASHNLDVAFDEMLELLRK